MDRKRMLSGRMILSLSRERRRVRKLAKSQAGYSALGLLVAVVVLIGFLAGGFFLLNRVGTPGPKGATGEQGARGDTGNTGATGPQGPSGSATCTYGNCLSLQATSPGTQETGAINVSDNATIGGTLTASSLSGNGSAVSSLNASQLASGTVSDARLSSSVSLLGQTISNTELENSSLTINTGSGLSNGSTVALGGVITLTNSGVLSVTGTANQITVSGSTGNVTFSLPQDIAITSGPTFASLTVTSNITAAALTFGTSLSSSCAGLTNYVWVPGNPKFGTLPGFCVMKYEAKDDGSGNAVSTASGTPWINMSQITAEDKSQAACTGCHLLTDAEWMTIATNALWQDANWCNLAGDGCNNAPGTANKYLATGHEDNSPAAALAASATDSQACYGTVTAGTDTACGTADTQKRTLTLSTGSVIWDIPGNVWEWTDGWIMGNEEPYNGVNGFGWKEFTAITQWRGLQYANPTSRGWNSSQRLGQIYTDGTSTNNTLYALKRGGVWFDGTHAGAFALDLFGEPADTNSAFGFRVAR